MCSTGDNAALPALGFPIRKSADHRLFSAYPRLIAAVHVLHRLLVPRHPPCALTILTVIWPFASLTFGERPGDTRCRSRLSMRPTCGYCAVFKDRGEAKRSLAPASSTDAPSVGTPRRRRRTPVSQNSTACWGRLWRRHEPLPVGREDAAATVQPGSVDVLGPIDARTTSLEETRGRDRGARRRSLERR